MLTDPRADNCKAYKLDAAGKCVGVEMLWVDSPSLPYTLKSVTLLNEYQASGNHVARYSIVDAQGIPVTESVLMYWPWPTLNAPDSPSGPGNPNHEFTISSVYETAKTTLGPLALAVADASGKPISGYIVGFGLPNGAHICWELVFQLRGGDSGGGGGGTVDMTVTNALLVSIRDLIKAGFRLS